MGVGVIASAFQSSLHSQNPEVKVPVVNLVNVVADQMHPNCLVFSVVA